MFYFIRIYFYIFFTTSIPVREEALRDPFSNTLLFALALLALLLPSVCGINASKRKVVIGRSIIRDHEHDVINSHRLSFHSCRRPVFIITAAVAH
eukprot:scaffold935_cov155-Amphora_coffeaeformis.AAC.10